MYINLKSVIAALGAALLVGCGGGGGSPIPPAITLTLSGTAATGAAIANGTIAAKCSEGTASSTSNADGTYTLTSTSAKLPCLLRVTVPATGEVIHSVAEADAARANITPMTDLIASNVMGGSAATKFASFTSTESASISASKIGVALLTIKEALLAAGIDISNTDPLKVTFVAASGSVSGDANDQLIDQLMLALAAADKKIADLSQQLATVTKAQAQSAITTTLGNSLYTLEGCPYVRGGNFWTFQYNGTNLKEWVLDLNAMTVNLANNSTKYAVNRARDSSTIIEPCAYTFDTGTSVVTVYVSESGVMNWKEQINSNSGWYFGLAVPKQTTHNLSDIKYVGRFPGMVYVDVTNGGANYLNAGIFYFDVNSNGDIAFTNCDLTTTKPSCGSAQPDDNDTMTCTANSNGTLNCISKDQTVSATAILYVSQQEPSLFITYSATISGLPTKALMIATKTSELIPPAVGNTLNKASSWYMSRGAKNNANTGWTFNSGDTTFGASTTVTSVNSSDMSFMRESGQVTFYNLPTTGYYWIPSYVPSGGTATTNFIGLRSKGGWTVGASAIAGSRVFDGRAFYIRKPTF